MNRFEGKRLLVTGGTSGIGMATARRLQEEGARVLVTGLSEDHLAEAAEAFGEASVLRNDAADPQAAQALGDWVQQQAGQLDGAFLNAGFGRFASLEETTPETFDSQFAVNVRGPLLHAQAIAPLLNDGGALLLNASVSHLLGMPNQAVYAATKGAVRSMTRVLARELAPRGIRVNAVSPGPVETNFFDGMGLSDKEIEGFAEQITEVVPLGRFGKPEELAGAAAFLLSDDASYVTGVDMVVDGGMTQL